MDQTTQGFETHLEDLLQRFFEQLALLRRAVEAEATQRRLIEGIFRSVHSIKGAAATIELPQVVAITHQLEELLADIRGGKLRLNPQVLQAFEDAGNLLTIILSPGPDAETSIETLKSELKEVREQFLEITIPAEEILRQLPLALTELLTEDQKVRLAHLVGAGANFYLISPTFDVADFDMELSRLRHKLDELGEIISTHPSVDQERPETVNFRLLFVTQHSAARLRSATELQNVPITRVRRHSDRLADTGISEFEAPLRLPISEIDRIARPLDELFSLIEKSLRFAIENASDDIRAQLVDSAQTVDQATAVVKREVSELRLVSAGQILNKAVRAGRAAARACSKDIRLHVHGEDVRLDRSVAGAVADALVHLVRNAVDHGIESAEERSTRNKPPHGTVTVEAISEVNVLYLRVSDDGRGIDAAEVARAAAASGFTTEPGTVTTKECLELIFQPGVSTKYTASETSGRGVGLDVVRKSVATVGGEVRVTTERGKGTTFEIRIPRSGNPMTV